MSSIISITQANVTSQPNVYQYNFPSGSVNFKQRKVAVSSVILPYSWYNVTSIFVNKNFCIVIPVTNVSATTTLNITITPGFYTVSQLNSYIQNQLIINNIGYLYNGTSNVYYIEIVANLVTDSAQLNCYVVPNTLPGGWTNPGSWALPSTGTRVPQLVISSTQTGFGKLIGFGSGTFPASSTQTSTYSIQSQFNPQISPVSSVLMTVSLVNNILSSPNNIIGVIPITSQYATQIIYAPNELLWIDCLDGTLPSFTVSFLDQFSNQLGIIDTNITVSLILK